MGRALSVPFDQCDVVGAWFIYPCNYTTKLHQSINGSSLQFCKLRNHGVDAPALLWKFSCTKATIREHGENGIKVKRVPWDYKRTDDLEDGPRILTEGMPGVRAQQWERIAFVFDQMSGHDSPVDALIEIDPALTPHASRLRAWQCGNGIMSDDDDVIITLCEQALNAQQHV